MVGGSGTTARQMEKEIPKGLEGEGDDGRVRNEGTREKRKERGGKRKNVKEEKGGKEWILKKKELYRKRGKEE
jgi:18S rRNA (guanine1575-N7)-methyltransferase